VTETDISVFWLRVATALYLPAIVYAALLALRRAFIPFRAALASFGLGAVFHFVSLIDLWRQTGHFPAQSFYDSISLCAFLLATLFLFVNWRYQFESLSILIFPLVFLMALVGATSAPVGPWRSDGVRDAWLLLHVTLAVAGYASLLLAAAASIFYLLQEQRLKAKQLSHKLPPLAILDNLLSRSMGIGFVLITLATVMGSIWGFIESGTQWVADPKILVAWITWLGYLLLVFLRLGIGWRGRKVAITAIGVLGVSVLTWVTHIGIREHLSRLP
jgi:ABC-type transport system involved in cytochrome c biogenesis permease subunit